MYLLNRMNNHQSQRKIKNNQNLVIKRIKKTCKKLNVMTKIKKLKAKN